MAWAVKDAVIVSLTAGVTEPVTASDPGSTVALPPIGPIARFQRQSRYVLSEIAA